MAIKTKTVRNQQSANCADNPQFEYWNGEVGTKWRDNHAMLEAMFASITKDLIETVGNVENKSIIDIGCGAGDISKQLADFGAKTVGIDLSKPLLEIANSDKNEKCQFIEGDVLQFETDIKFDIGVSRFGLMFFDDPINGFRHIKSLLKPNGQLIFMVWQLPIENEWVQVPKNALEGIAQAQSANSPDAPGPFALARIERLNEILKCAGFFEYSIVSSKHKMPFAAGSGINGAVELLSKIGPASRSITQLNEIDKRLAYERLEEALMPYLKGNTVYLEGAVHLVKASV